MKYDVRIPIILLMICLTACSEEEQSIKPVASAPYGEVIYFSDCKTFSENVDAAFTDRNESAVEYSYDAKRRILTLKHINAAFNCCPGTISTVIHVEDALIQIREQESEALCNCNCLFDVEIEIRAIEQAEYRILFIEPYVHPNDIPISFSIDLSTSMAGRFSVPRLNADFRVES